MTRHTIEKKHNGESIVHCVLASHSCSSCVNYFHVNDKTADSGHCITSFQLTAYPNVCHLSPSMAKPRPLCLNGNHHENILIGIVCECENVLQIFWAFYCHIITTISSVFEICKMKSHTELSGNKCFDADCKTAKNISSKSTSVMTSDDRKDMMREYRHILQMKIGNTHLILLESLIG